MAAFLKDIPQDVMAKAALRSKAYTRALMHFEAYMLEGNEDIKDHLTFLQVRPSSITCPLAPKKTPQKNLTLQVLSERPTLNLVAY